MDGDHAAIEKKMEMLLRELASVDDQLRRCRPGSTGTPHYSEIEDHAHAMAGRLSRVIQQEAMRDEMRRAGDKAKCPDCGRVCRLEFKQRTIESIDGPVDISEPAAHCPRCQRSFFPST